MGIYLRGRSWVSDFFHDGERYTKSWGEISKSVAKEKDAKFKTEVKEGKHTLKAKKILFEKFAEKYLEYARLNKKPKSAKRNEVSINMLKLHFKGKLLGSIHPFMLEQYKKTRKEEGRAVATINRDLVTMKNMFRKAVEWGNLSINLLSGVKQFRENNEKMWVLTLEEEAKLLEACQKSPQRKGAKYLRDLVLFGLNSGMRLNEIFDLKKSDADLINRFLIVRDSKNNEGRKVPINDTLKELLERRLKDERSDFIFHNSKNQKLTVLTNAFWRAVKDSGLTRIEGEEKSKTVRFRFHDLRHTFGTRLGMAGTDLKTIMEIMGHRTTRVAMRYQHPMPGHKLNAVKTLDRVPSFFPSSEKTEAKIVNFYR